MVELRGIVWIVRNGQRLATPFLDVRGQVIRDEEQGFFSIAFHPDYETNGRFFVCFTSLNGDTRVVRYRVSGDPDVADPGSARIIISVPQPRTNHNGGQLAFGPDGMLYISLGDGGGRGDPDDNGQDPSTLLGTILRLDVDSGNPFSIPADNPFVGQAGRDEIWAWGLRNPWRFSFDPVGGTIYIADVGQSAFEEVNAVPATAAGVNYGWDVMEARVCFGGGGCDQSGLTPPVLDYAHIEGCNSITGGYVYRGQAYPAIVGHYFYSDFCRGFLRSFRLEGGVATDLREWSVGDIDMVVSFGVDGQGELYVLSRDGRVRQIVTFVTGD